MLPMDQLFLPVSVSASLEQMWMYWLFDLFHGFHLSPDYAEVPAPGASLANARALLVLVLSLFQI